MRETRWLGASNTNIERSRVATFSSTTNGMLISTGADVCYQGKKIIGSAQYRKNGYILQHGSILFNYDKKLLESLFDEEICPDSITTVNEILPQMTKEEFVKNFESFILKRS